MLEVLRSTWDTVDLFDQLREHAPVMHVPELDAWVLSRYEDCMAVVRNTKAFGAMPSDLVGEVPDEVKPDLPHGYAPWQPALVNQDPPEHTRAQARPEALTTKALAVREDEIREVADGLIDGFVADGRADLAADYATPTPVHVLSRIIGIPDEDVSQFREWTLGITELFVPSISDERRLELAREQVHFTAYIEAAIEARRRDPGDDLISGLILVRRRARSSSPIARSSGSSVS